MPTESIFERYLRCADERGLQVARNPTRDGDAKVEHHGERTPSLHITDTGEGGIVGYCFGCGERDQAVIAAHVGLSRADMGGRSVRRPRRPNRKAEVAMVRVAERAEQQERIDADPSYWLRRAAEWDRVGTTTAAWIAWACRMRAWAESW
jgi:hypothetical protein